MEKNFDFKKVAKTMVTVTDKFINIERKGFMNKVNLGNTGSKRIAINSMTGVQIKKPGLTNGYIQFIFSGSSDSKGGVFDAVKDENSIMFNKAEYKMAQELQELVESYIYAEKDTPATVQTNSTLDVAEQLKKLKELLDIGAINQSEFDAKKEELLARM